MAKSRIGSYNFCSAVEVLEHASDPVGLMADPAGLASQGKLMVFIGTCTSDRVVTDEQTTSFLVVRRAKK